MRKHILPLLILITVSASVAYFLNPGKDLTDSKKGTLTKEEIKALNNQRRQRQEFLMLRDIRTNKIPDNIYFTEQIFAEKLPKRLEFTSLRGVLAKNAVSLTWDERGPNNVGGRVRAFGIDVANASTLIAGGISGGIWKSINDGTSWSKKTANSQLHSVSCLIQDTRSGKTSTWYAGSGEGVANSADGGGSASYRGNGIFKSTDNGDNWTLLTSTSTSTPQLTGNFSYVWDVAIDPTNNANDVVYAATTRGIWKSTDGGTTWAVKLGNVAGTYPTYSTVKVAPNGTVYAAANSGSNMAGIYKSTDAGENWTNITSGSFPSSYARLVLEISDNSNILYVFANTPSVGQDGDGGKADQYVSLWYYDVTANSGAGAWTNRSANLPAFVNPVAGLNPQGSYNMMLRLKPGTTDYLVIGATNLYVSSDGFATNTNTNWVGGYATANNISQYANHHSDQHAGGFGSGNVYYSCNDGGVQKTSDITAATVAWTSLDNGLNITQCYSVAIEREASRNFIVSGFQDNACWYGNSAGASTWTSVGSGDGAIVAVGNASTDNVLFSTSQNGGLDRYDKSGGYLGDMKPASAAHQAFTNPLALDPISSSLLYYGGGTSATTTGIWRNNDALNGTTATGWSYITDSDFGSTSATVSAIAISNDNVVYYGSDEGHVKKISSANGTPSVSANFTGLPSGYVSGIAVDPTNSNKAVVVFSNYVLQSIWYTTDGGSNWSDVEGNLAGDTGPSIRSAKIFYISGELHVFLGTSVGLYYTNVLNGASTVWTQEATTSIGNVVIPYLDFRSSDNTLAAATHGRGVFTSVVASPLPVELITFTAVSNDGDVFLNWQTATEVNNYGFEIERRENFGLWTKVGFKNGHGNSNSPKNYSYIDKNVPNGKIEYRLKQIDFDGKFEYSNVIQIEIHNANMVELAQNFPNPFNPTTTISYNLPKNSNVKLIVYDAIGKEITTLVNGMQPAGNYKINFNGSRFASGVYYYRIQAGDIIQTKKMILMK